MKPTNLNHAYLPIALRLMQVLKDSGNLEPGQIFDTDVSHDEACPFLQDGTCSCDPIITIRKGSATGPAVALYENGNYMLSRHLSKGEIKESATVDDVRQAAQELANVLNEQPAGSGTVTADDVLKWGGIARID